MSDYNIDAEERGVHTETRNGNSDEPESEYEDEVKFILLKKVGGGGIFCHTTSFMLKEGLPPIY